MRVSHETIYTSLFVHSKAALRTELAGRLHTRHVHRRPHRRVWLGGQRRNRFPDLRPISERPVEVLGRAHPGPREGGLLVGRYGRSHLITLVDRHSNLLIMMPIPCGFQLSGDRDVLSGVRDAVHVDGPVFDPGPRHREDHGDEGTCCQFRLMVMRCPAQLSRSAQCKNRLEDPENDPSEISSPEAAANGD